MQAGLSSAPSRRVGPTTDNCDSVGYIMHIRFISSIKQRTFDHVLPLTGAFAKVRRAAPCRMMRCFSASLYPLSLHLDEIGEVTLVQLLETINLVQHFVPA